MKHYNGFQIDYIDNVNRHQTIFIRVKSWDVARRVFEDLISHTIIVQHKKTTS